MAICNITFQKKSGEIISLTIEEAKELYNELAKLFDTKSPNPLDLRDIPWIDPKKYNPQKYPIVTCETDTVVRS